MEETQEYLVLIQIGGAGDPEVWQPGSKIRLGAVAAGLHLAANNVRAIETTGPLPKPSASPVIVHKPEESVAPKVPAKKVGD